MTDAPDADLRLFLVRHAHSGWAVPGMRDFDRPLDDRGREEAARLAALLVVNGYQPRRVVSSPAARCLETLDILAPHFTARPSIVREVGLYSGSFETYLDAIASHAAAADGMLMLIGHNPMLEDAAHALLVHDAEGLAGPLRAGFPTAGLLVVDSHGGPDEAIAGNACFVGLVSPVDA